MPKLRKSTKTQLFLVFVISSVLIAGGFLINSGISAKSSSCEPNEFLVCHKPGTPAQQEICLNQDKLQGHLKHGDNEGACVVIQADLNIDKSVNTSSANEGDVVEYTITVHNNGPDAATGVSISDILPAGLEFVHSVATTGSYNNNVWTIGDLASGSNAVLEIEARISAGQAGNTIANTAAVSADQQDPDSSNNSDSVQVEVRDNVAAVDDNFTINEDEVLSPDAPGLLGNDGEGLTASLANNPNHGSVTVNSDGSFTYTPNQDFSGEDSFTYTACSNSNVCSGAAVYISVAAVNDPPIAGDDVAGSVQGVPVVIEVLADDLDVDGDALAVLSVTQPANGTTVINSDNTITYTSNPDFEGTDTFTYTITDGNGNESIATATVTVTVVGVVSANNPPQAVDDAVSVDEDTVLIIDALANDSDPDGDTLTIDAIHTQSVHGTEVINSDNTITYTPNENFNGEDSFGYTVCDNGTPQLCAEAQIIVTVNSVNDAPIVADDLAGASVSTETIIEVLADDIDADDDVLTVLSVTQPANGTVVINNDNTITYTSNEDFEGTDTFTYEACDTANLCNIGSVTVTVTSTNSPPAAVDDTAITNEDTVLIIDALANDSDPDGDTLIIDAIHTQSVHGTEVINSDNTITYTPNENFNGEDSFGYTVCDNGTPQLCTEAQIIVTVNDVNHPPQATDDVAGSAQGEPVVIEVLADDIDADDDALTVLSVTQPANGTVVINSDNTITYTSNPDFEGTDTFTYTITDGNGNESIATATVTVTVVGVVSANNPPNAVDDAVSVDEDESLIITPLANDSDDGTITIKAIHTQSVHGTAVINSNNTITYTPNENFNGEDSFGYTVCDNGTPQLCAEARITVTVNEVNDPPIAQDDTITFNQSGPSNIFVLSNDGDADDNKLEIISFDSKGGAVALNNNNTPDIKQDDYLVYTPAGDFTGTDSFTYTVSDGQNEAAATVTVMINNPPRAIEDIVSVDQDNSLEIHVMANDVDPEGDALTLQAVSETTANGRAVIKDNDTLLDLSDDFILYTPPPGFYGTDTFIYTITDQQGTTDAALVTIDVQSSGGGSASSSGSSGSRAAPVPVKTIPVIAAKAVNAPVQLEKEVSQVKPVLCSIDCDSFDYVLHIINPDGSERYINTEYVKAEEISPKVMSYHFEDKGADFDYNDLEVIIDTRVCSNVHAKVMGVNADWNHKIALKLLQNGRVKSTVILWDSSHRALGRDKIINPEMSEQYCSSKQCNVECKDIDYDLYIINPDETERHIGDRRYVREEKIGTGKIMYNFEDSGRDFDYDDVIVQVDRSDCGKLAVTAKSDKLTSHGWHHRIVMDIENKKGDKITFPLWHNSHSKVDRTTVVDLGHFKETCME